jgi:hypothetical protein
MALRDRFLDFGRGSAVCTGSVEEKKKEIFSHDQIHSKTPKSEPRNDVIRCSCERDAILASNDDS